MCKYHTIKGLQWFNIRVLNPCAVQEAGERAHADSSTCASGTSGFALLPPPPVHKGGKVGDCWSNIWLEIVGRAVRSFS